jgi:hypothetical protein
MVDMADAVHVERIHDHRAARSISHACALYGLRRAARMEKDGQSCGLFRRLSRATIGAPPVRGDSKAVVAKR